MNAPRRSHGAQPEYWEPVRPDIPAQRSPARELVGNPAERDFDEPIDPDPPQPGSLLLLDRYDQIMSLGVIEEPRRRRRLARVRYEHVMVCKWLDRFGFMTTEQLHRAVLPRRTLRATQDLLYRMRVPPFTTETEIHRGSMLAWRLPELPRALRDQLGYEGFPVAVVDILPPELAAAG